MNTRANGAENRAFSLVELTLAIGLISFCLMALLGLFEVGMKGGRQAANDTVLAATASRLASEIIATRKFSFPATRYFDVDGESVAQSAALYGCTISSATVPDSQLPGISTNLVRVSMVFAWPLSAPASAQTTHTFYVTLPPQ